MQIEKEENKYAFFTYDENLGISETHWREITREMLEEDYKSHQLKRIDFLQGKYVRGLLLNTKKFHFVINLKMQKWVWEIVMPAYAKIGVKNLSSAPFPSKYVIRKKCLNLLNGSNIQ